MKYLAAISLVLLLSACSDPNEGNPNFDGYTYIGKTTPKEVCRYVDDSKQATLYAVNQYPDIESVSYYPESGEIVVELESGRNLRDFEARDIMRTFAKKRLRVTDLVEKRSNGLIVRHQWKLRYGGTSRFRALSDVSATCE